MRDHQDSSAQQVKSRLLLMRVKEFIAPRWDNDT
jgi:hypothetical protein